MKKKTMLYLASAAAVGIYSAIEGKGPFNKLKFKDQHEAVLKYMQTHYPKSLYSPITETQNGWMTVIRRLSAPNIILYITRTPDGHFVFREEPLPPDRKKSFFF